MCVCVLYVYVCGSCFRAIHIMLNNSEIYCKISTLRKNNHTYKGWSGPVWFQVTCLLGVIHTMVWWVPIAVRVMVGTDMGGTVSMLRLEGSWFWPWAVRLVCSASKGRGRYG